MVKCNAVQCMTVEQGLVENCGVAALLCLKLVSCSQNRFFHSWVVCYVVVMRIK